jgi:hypothetical protein
VTDIDSGGPEQRRDHVIECVVEWESDHGERWAAVPHQTGVRTFMWVYELLGVVYELVSLDFKPRISSHVFTFWFSSLFFVVFSGVQ